MYENFIKFTRELYQEPNKLIPLHAPVFFGNEEKYLIQTIKSTYVSSIGEFVTRFEDELCKITHSKYAVATVNGTSALHTAFLVSKVSRNELIITQPLTFIATCNAISYTGANPLFIDIDLTSYSLSPEKLHDFLKKNTILEKDGRCMYKSTKQIIKAIVPVHTFGHPAKLDDLFEICKMYNLMLIEDAAESVGSYFKTKHTGTIGDIGVLSFNGNKTITCGGGGALITNNLDLATWAKHITTQAKQDHAWEFIHDQVGYNYRMPNINAALAVAQLEKLNNILLKKRKLAEQYKDYCCKSGLNFLCEPNYGHSNYWLNSIILRDLTEREKFLHYTNKKGIMTRPAWRLMPKLNMYKNCIKGNIDNAEWLANRLVNIPSGIPYYWIDKEKHDI